MMRIPLLAAGVLLCAQAQTPPGPAVQQTNLTVLANGTLEQARQARASLSAGNRQAALGSVDQALSMARRAEELMRAASPAGAGPMLVPLEAEVEVETTYKPRRAGADTTVRVEDTTGTVAGRSLNVTAARQHLEAARAALDRNDTAAAQSSLAAVESSVRGVTATSELPLVRARQNLESARGRAAAGQPGAARDPLREAARALREYEAIAPAAQAGEVAALRTDIEAYARRVGRDRKNAPARIDTFLARVDRWTGSAADRRAP